MKTQYSQVKQLKVRFQFSFLSIPLPMQGLSSNIQQFLSVSVKRLETTNLIQDLQVKWT